MTQQQEYDVYMPLFPASLPGPAWAVCWLGVNLIDTEDWRPRQAYRSGYFWTDHILVWNVVEWRKKTHTLQLNYGFTNIYIMSSSANWGGGGSSKSLSMDHSFSLFSVHLNAFQKNNSQNVIANNKMRRLRNERHLTTQKCELGCGRCFIHRAFDSSVSLLYHIGSIFYFAFKTILWRRRSMALNTSSPHGASHATWWSQRQVETWPLCVPKTFTLKLTMTVKLSHNKWR